jgi:hypothetical protein
MRVTKMGVVLFEVIGNSGKQIRLENVLYVPELAQSLLSVSKLDERGAKLLSYNGETMVMKENQEVMKAVKAENNMWIATVKARTLVEMARCMIKTAKPK